MSLRKVSEATGPVLDWMVAKADGEEGDCEVHGGNVWYGKVTSGFVVWCPSTTWSQGGPIIERERIQLLPSITKCEQPWHSSNPANDYVSHQYGPTLLIAAMRCYVASKLGDEVEVPDGMVMVPREPTEDMIQAAAGAWGESEGGLHNAFAAALRGGITAAPAAPVAPNGCEKIFTHKWLDPDCIEQGCKSLAAPVVREPQPEPVQRLMRFAGKKRSEVSNPCLTAREAIVIADWMQAHGITGGKP